MLSELCGKVVGVSVAVDHDTGTAQTRTVDQAGVVERVAEDDVVGAGERRDDANVGCVTGREEQGALLSRQLREAAL
jgi:hypothetical protein